MISRTHAEPTPLGLTNNFVVTDTTTPVHSLGNFAPFSTGTSNFNHQTSSFTVTDILGEGQSNSSYNSGNFLVNTGWVPENYVTAKFIVSDATTFNFDYNIISVLGSGTLTSGATTIFLGATDTSG